MVYENKENIVVVIELTARYDIWADNRDRLCEGDFLQIENWWVALLMMSGGANGPALVRRETSQ